MSLATTESCWSQGAFVGSTRHYPGLTLTSYRSQGGGCMGDEEDDDNGYKVDGDEVNGDY